MFLPQAAQELPTYANFVVAGASGMSAWMFIHPVDLVKTRMQLLGDKRGDATAMSVGKELVSTGLVSVIAGTRQPVHFTDIITLESFSDHNISVYATSIDDGFSMETVRHPRKGSRTAVLYCVPFR